MRALIGRVAAQPATSAATSSPARTAQREGIVSMRKESTKRGALFYSARQRLCPRQTYASVARPRRGDRSQQSFRIVRSRDRGLAVEDEKRHPVDADPARFAIFRFHFGEKFRRGLRLSPYHAGFAGDARKLRPLVEQSPLDEKSVKQHFDNGVSGGRIAAMLRPGDQAVC